MASLRTLRTFSAISLFVLALAGGCDLTGSYLARVEETGPKLKSRWDRMKYLGQTLTVSDTAGGKTGVTVTMPEVFGQSIKFKPLPPSMPAAKGFVGMCEAESNDGGGPIALIGAFDSSLMTVDQAISGLALVSAAFAPGVAGQRTELGPVVGDDNNSSPPMTVVSYIGNQRLLKDDPALSGTAEPGRTDIFITTTAKHHIVFVFRASDSAALKTHFSDAVRQSMESVRIDPSALAAPAATPEAAAAPMPMGS